MSNITCIRSRLRWLIGIPLLAACASDTVPLGGGNQHEPPPAGSRCSAAPVLDASVHVSSQEALAALAGCEEITGDLIIEVFVGADVGPLASLRVVGGDLQLGAHPGSDRQVIYGDEIADLQRLFEQGIRAGYLPSLSGLESLERTGNLQIAHITAPSLAVFAHLRSIGSHRDVGRAGRLILDDNAHLIDLHGLENALGIFDVILTENPALESLEGLALLTTLQHIDILDSPRLGALGPLASVGSLDTLVLDGVGVRDLDDLHNLGIITDVSISNNLELENVDGLSQLVVGSLDFWGNPKLARLPAFSDLSMIDSFRAVDNDELAAIRLQLPIPPRGQERVQNTNLYVGPSVFEIARNPKLQTISLAAGLPLAQHVAIYDNANLASIELGTLQNLDTLSLSDNASLSQVGLGELKTVDVLTVTDNPLLATAELEHIPTFERVVARNAPEPAP